MCESKTKIDIGFYKGIILTIVLFSIFQLLYVVINSPSQLILSLYKEYGYLTYDFGRQLYLDTQLLFIYIIRLIIVYLTVHIFIGNSITASLFHNRPSRLQNSYWISVGVCLALYSSMMAWQESFEDPFYIVLLSTVIAVLANIVSPLQEEIVHRGILFSALLKKDRLLAYFISVAWFVFCHIPSYSDLFFNGVLGLALYHFIFLILMAVFASYIYETTKKLSLCVIFHSACNLTTVASSFLNYIVEKI